MGKPKLSAQQIEQHKAEARDSLHKLDGTGEYAGDMGNMCYGDGYFAQSLLRKYNIEHLGKLRDWAFGNMQGSMKVNPKAEKVYTTDPYYDLFDGGYIDPEKLLEEGAEEVRNAIILVAELLEYTVKQGVLEIN